ncbi:hypothetical protein BDP55DRAFT_657726 [Colletotrichum godetiae]|uniref:Uncharacterized protein n=1 Tax=Colletotrichum godetiae TaxID=1209918 RepID=A0AAJ0F0C9_9PEZI|nr:uncharacterized protein BDP55DRAFT_657726 [Colletotrichum godetiae]KAK1688347.1 hypothetical protein BDP55DRAFT_657726 [Colletotrichum godetiae]
MRTCLVYSLGIAISQTFTTFRSVPALRRKRAVCSSCFFCFFLRLVGFWLSLPLPLCFCVGHNGHIKTRNRAFLSAEGLPADSSYCK